MNAKRILAILAIILLVGMYGMTLVFAIFDNPATMNLLAASLAMTILIPTVLWLLKMFFGLASSSKDKDHNTPDDAE